MKKSINDFLKDPVNNSDEHYNFYDWFGSDDYDVLKNKMLKMVPKLKFLVKSGIIDGDTHYVWFKENQTITGKYGQGTLNVDMRFSELESNTFKGGLNPNVGKFNEHNIEIWYFEGGNDDSMMTDLQTQQFYTWKEFRDTIKNEPEYKEELTKAFA